MGIIAGVLGLDAEQSETTYLRTVGTQAVYDEVAKAVGMWNMQRDAIERLFVGSSGPEHTRRYYLPGNGRMQKMGFDPQGRPIARGVGGYWDVGFPLTEFADRIAASRVTYAYLSVADMDRQIAGVIATDANTTVNLILSALFDDQQWTYSDVKHGSTTVVPLANGDSVVYPPTLGTESGATDDHYLASGYVSADISDTNDPFPTMVDELEEHFGIPTGGSPVVVFVNNAQMAVIASELTDYIPILANTVSPGDQTATVLGLPPDRFLPNTARVMGTHASTGAYIVRWDRIPANYMVAMHTGVAAPIRRRVDPAGTGLSSALTMIVNDFKEPFHDMQWNRRVGYAVENRLNCVVMQLTAGSYSTPTGYTASVNY